MVLPPLRCEATAVYDLSRSMCLRLASGISRLSVLSCPICARGTHPSCLVPTLSPVLPLPEGLYLCILKFCLPFLLSKHSDCSQLRKCHPGLDADIVIEAIAPGSPSCVSIFQCQVTDGMEPSSRPSGRRRDRCRKKVKRTDEASEHCLHSWWVCILGIGFPLWSNLLFGPCCHVGLIS
jgi:hypothetical protein